MTSQAYILDTGIITAIGHNTQQCYQSLSEKKDGITYSKFLNTTWKHTFPVGEIALSNEEISVHVGCPSNWPRTALLSAFAVKEILEKNTWLKNETISFFSANSVGGMDKTELVYNKLVNDFSSVNEEHYLNHECGAITNLVAEYFDFNGLVTTISTACSSSANSIMLAAQMIEQGLIDVAIAGGADALSKFTLNGFNSLMIVDQQKCQPFDNNRRGLNLGEGAGYILLVSKKILEQYNQVPRAFVSGYANANDAYHQTASSPEGRGNQLAMKNALTQANLSVQDIDYINAHGTGTPNNDSAESIAIEKVFGSIVPPFSSTKCYTGHTLGAAGGIEAVFSLLSLEKGAIYANVRLEKPMEDVTIKPVVDFTENNNIINVMSNSFGFGGNCSTLILSKC